MTLIEIFILLLFVALFSIPVAIVWRSNPASAAEQDVDHCIDVEWKVVR